MLTPRTRALLNRLFKPIIIPRLPRPAFVLFVIGIGLLALIPIALGIPGSDSVWSQTRYIILASAACILLGIFIVIGKTLHDCHKK